MGAKSEGLNWNIHNETQIGEMKMGRDEIYFKMRDNVVINTVPALHVLNGVMSQEIVDDVYKYMDSVNDNSASTSLIANISGDQSNMDTEHPLLKGYMNQLYESCGDYIKLHHRNTPITTNQHGLDHASDFANKKLELVSCWSVKMNPNGDYNPLHHHETKSRNGLATICYIKVPESIPRGVGKGLNDGCLQFSWNAQTGPEDMFSTKSDAMVCPQVGHYFIFPKWLNHMVWPYVGHEQRWSIQANFDIAEVQNA